jgi:PITH domain
MSGHGGGHACSAECDHSAEADVGSAEWSLYTRVKLDSVVCLNEAEERSGGRVLRPWASRFDRDAPVLRSDCDEQLLLVIPFVAPVKIKSICVIGGGGDESPAEVKSFVNREGMDFGAAETSECVQKWELVENNGDGRIEYPTRFSRFQNVSTLTLFFNRNFGAETTVIQYIGLKGEYTEYKREAVESVYESRPLAAPKKVSEESSRMGM